MYKLLAVLFIAVAAALDAIRDSYIFEEWHTGFIGRWWHEIKVLALGSYLAAGIFTGLAHPNYLYFVPGLALIDFIVFEIVYNRGVSGSTVYLIRAWRIPEKWMIAVLWLAFMAAVGLLVG